MKPQVTGDKFLEVKYDREMDILYVLIPGRKIQVSNEVTSPLIIDFGSEEDGFDVIGFELHAASQYLSSFFRSDNLEISAA
jgi:uncharacterized protein YuzE